MLVGSRRLAGCGPHCLRYSLVEYVEYSRLAPRGPGLLAPQRLGPPIDTSFLADRHPSRATAGDAPDQLPVPGTTVQDLQFSASGTDIAAQPQQLAPCWLTAGGRPLVAVVVITIGLGLLMCAQAPSKCLHGVSSRIGPPRCCGPCLGGYSVWARRIGTSGFMIHFRGGAPASHRSKAHARACNRD